MKDYKKLPELDDLCKIARAVGDYPTTTDEVIKTANRMGYKLSVTDFLKKFTSGGINTVFTSRADLYTRTAELLMLTLEEAYQPKEKQLSYCD